ncbi:hypothetical protein EJ08DRAFT_370780 [Tothia fuscella]|uniref:Secreted protein n=1 Tax=Tothia fuscella TaxID=1048955 RepID=A0A9P4NLP3_9PEZI|nr:hypothetical protein EJ08DRAFT_370780 [Tothia fuscella]
MYKSFCFSTMLGKVSSVALVGCRLATTRLDLQKDCHGRYGVEAVEHVNFSTCMFSFLRTADFGLLLIRIRGPHVVSTKSWKRVVDPPLAGRWRRARKSGCRSVCGSFRTCNTEKQLELRGRQYCSILLRVSADHCRSVIEAVSDFNYSAQ